MSSYLMIIRYVLNTKHFFDIRDNIWDSCFFSRSNKLPLFKANIGYPDTAYFRLASPRRSFIALYSTHNCIFAS